MQILRNVREGDGSDAVGRPRPLPGVPPRAQRWLPGTKSFTDRFPFFGPGLWIMAITFFVAQVGVAYEWQSKGSPPAGTSPDHQYSFFANTISDLGETAKFSYGSPSMWSPAYRWMNLAFWVLGGLMIVGSLVIYQEFSDLPDRKWCKRFGFGFQALAGVGVILVGTFPENTWSHGHEVGAGLAIAVGSLGVFLLSWALPLPPRIIRFMRWYMPIALVAIALYVLHEYLGFGPGGMERIAAYPEVIWLISFGIYISHSHWKRGSAHRLPTLASQEYGQKYHGLSGRLRLTPRSWLPIGHKREVYQPKNKNGTANNNLFGSIGSSDGGELKAGGDGRGSDAEDVVANGDRGAMKVSAPEKVEDSERIQSAVGSLATEREAIGGDGSEGAVGVESEGPYRLAKTKTNSRIGLTFSQASGTLSGTPQGWGPVRFPVQFTEGGNTVKKTYMLLVVPWRTRTKPADGRDSRPTERSVDLRIG